MSNLLNEVYDLLDNAHHYGEYVMSVCIFHEDTKPSLMIHEDSYKCLACGASGKTEWLLRKLQGKSPSAITEKKNFRNPFTRWIEDEGSLVKVLKQAYKTYKIHPYLGTYINERGFSTEVALQYGLGIRENWMTIPMKDRAGKIVSAAARIIIQIPGNKRKYVVPHGHDPKIIYVPDWDWVSQSSYFLLTFGLLDALSLSVLNYPAGSTTTGQNLDPESLDWCRKRIYIIPDKGEEIAATRLASKLGWRGRLLTLDYPDGCKDCNDLFRQNLLQRFIMEGING